MTAVSISNALQNLKDLMMNAIKNNDEVVIVSDFGSVVVVDQREWESVQETLRLLKDKRALKALLEGHKLRDENKLVESKSIEEAFYDLQD